MSGDLVYLKCFREGSKLRVRIISSDYNNGANCQFPKNIREPDRVFSVPRNDISFSEGPNHKFFYRIKKNNIKILDAEFTNKEENKTLIKNIYEDSSEECIICFANIKEIVFAPCGHYCSCGVCANEIKKTSKKCPICRTIISSIVQRDQIQFS